jgi:hypothetical protein
MQDEGPAASGCRGYGGLVCVVITNVDGSTFWFGTANEEWGADVYASEQAYVQGESSALETDVSSGSHDPTAIARAISKAIRQSRLRHCGPRIVASDKSEKGVGKAAGSFHTSQVRTRVLSKF